MINLKLLWNIYYWDGPIAGIALFNKEKVYFRCIDPYISTRIELGKDIDLDNKDSYNKLSQKTRDFIRVNILNKSYVSDLEEPYEFDDCQIDIEDAVVCIQHSREYKLYRVPKNILEQAEERHWRWIECTKTGTQKDFEKIHSEKFNISDHIDSMEYICTVSESDLQCTTQMNT